MADYHYFIIYKPFGMLSQFTTPLPDKRTLGELYDFPSDVYPVGRLDEDSEGLLLLTNDPRANARLLGAGIEKEYYVQVEGIPSDTALAKLSSGVELRIKKKLHHTLPAVVKRLETEPNLPPRNPPIRFRANIPETWLSIAIREGKNRQVRRMTAAIGHPTLRLLRWRLGNITLGAMQVGEVLRLKSFD